MARQNFMFWPFFLILKFYFSHMSVKYGIDIPYNCKIGPGLYIGHYGGIIVNQDVVIGKNCNINHGATIGVAYGGKYPGCPKIGNNVFIGAGCKVFGGIEVGDDAAIGANCVVTQSVPPLGIIVGVPGKVISLKGSGAYVVNTI
jgi:serine O-acetyltransferase